MQPKWIHLEDWLSQQYGDKPPHLNTIYKWIKDGLIYPAPEKHGKDWYCRPESEYMTIEKQIAAQANQHPKVKRSLLERLGKAA
jgi:hypothetical protein